MTTTSVDVGAFDRLYAAERDPWGYETSGYERAKYARTLAALPTGSIGRALEMGCSIGVFSELLAERVSSLLAIDFSERAARLAQLRTRRFPHVRIERSDLREAMPSGPFDLIVCSELLYYWDATEVTLAARRMERALAPSGTLLAVHWRGKDPDAPLDGDLAHDLLDSSLRLRHTHGEVLSDYVVDRWERPR